MMLLGGNIRILARGFCIALGLCAAAWAAYSISYYRAEGLIVTAGRSVLAGDKFSAAHLEVLRNHLDETPTKSLRSVVLDDVAVIRLKLLESQLAGGKPEQLASDRAAAESAVSVSLAATPTDSFLWLADYWLLDPRARATERGQRLLLMSYWLGPNEGWIAVKRNLLALANFPSLPSELAELALWEFAKLVQSALYQPAADIIAASAPALRDKLLRQLAGLDESDRRRFAKALEFKNLDGVSVPGIDDKRDRPF
jgi:hypothetical protein